ncbi:MAG: hypothetical protein WA761_06310 [Thermoplasmata archaeon]
MSETRGPVEGTTDRSAELLGGSGKATRGHKGMALGLGALAFLLLLAPFANAATPAPLNVSGVNATHYTIDAGQSVTFSVTIVGGHSPYTVTWQGLPSGCNTTGTGVPSMDNVSTVVCAPSQSGIYPIEAFVTDSSSATTNTSVRYYQVSPDPTIAGIGAKVSDPTVGMREYIVAPVSGGSGWFSYLWHGLPSYCVNTNSAVSCWMNTTGNYSVYLVAQDSNNMTTTSPVLHLTVGPKPAPTPGNGTTTTPPQQTSPTPNVPSTAKSTSSSSEWVYWAIGAGAIGGASGLAIGLRQRKK